MATVSTVRPELRESTSSTHRAGILTAVSLAIMLVAVLLGTRSTFLGDTKAYAGYVASVVKGLVPFALLIDFTHVIWVPLGVGMARFGGGNWEVVRRQAALNLIYVNMLASAVGLAALWILMRLIKGVRPGAALLACVTFLCTNGFLLFSRTGTSYIPAMTCLLVACCFSVEASRRSSWSLSACAALFVAASVLFWVPYAFASISIACAPLLVWEQENPGRRLLLSGLRILPLAGLFVLAAYALAAYIKDIHTAAQVRDWMRGSIVQVDRYHEWLRMLFGLPRSFLVMGDEGVRWKRFLFHDPYAEVKWWNLLGSAWKIVLFYITMGVTLLQLKRWPWLLLWTIVVVVPTLAVAVAFEASSPERYLALYPAVFLALAWILSQREARPARILIVIFCGVLIVTNLWANWRFRVDGQRARTMARYGSIVTLPESEIRDPTVYALNMNDDLVRLYDPLDPSLDRTPTVQVLIPVMDKGIANWRYGIADTMLKTWRRGSEVWVTKRAWADQPQRDWNWVEGDDLRVPWTDVGAFLWPFQVDAQVGGADGFNRIADTSANRARAAAVVQNKATEH